MGYKVIDPSIPFATHVELQQCTPLSIRFQEAIQRRLVGMVITIGDEIQWNMCGKDIKFNILSMDQQQCRVHKQDTVIRFKVNRQALPFSEQEQNDIYLTSLADMIESSFTNSEAYKRLGIPVAKSILIHGVSGVGKTSLVKRVSQVLASTFYEISTHDLLSFDADEYDFEEFTKYNPFSLLVTQAILNSPSIVVIRDLDALGSAGDKTRKIIDIMSKEMNRISDNDPVCIVGLGQQLKSMPEALQKTDIFRQHMTLPIPSLPQRKMLLLQLLRDYDLKPPTDTSVNTIDYYATQISMRTSGYVVRDLKLLLRQAKLKSMRSKIDISEQLEQLTLSNKLIQWSDLEYALETYRPSQRSEVESTLPKRDWNDMGGYKVIKDRMKQAILLPLLNPHVFTKLGIKPPSGLLLYGPSGCGKTALVQALVSESMMNIISIKGPEIFSKYLGETENKLRKIFATAKRIAPCIVFIDEMDAIGTKRGFDTGESSGGVNERVLSTLLNEMDGVEGRQGVVVIGCTNRPDQIDDAILRPGRLDQLVFVGLPTLEDRIDIINTLMKKISVSNDINPVELAKQTEFCSGADLENLFREAGTAALRNDLNSTCINNINIQTVIVPICERAEDQILQGRLDMYEKFLHDHTL